MNEILKVISIRSAMSYKSGKDVINFIKKGGFI